MRKCIKCGSVKPIYEFCKTGLNRDGSQKYKSQCKDCYNSNWKYRLMSTLTSRESERRRYNGVKRKSLSVEKGINGKFLEDLKNKQNGMCYWLDIPIDFSMKCKLRKPSIDRLDNAKGYEVGNVVLTTLFANTGRRDASVDEMRKFVKTHL